jgi:hypothetical protein
MKISIDKIDIREEARSIFGDIVEYACINKTEWASKLDDTKISASNGSICPVDAYPVLIKFTNGKLVELWVSEFGSVRTFKPKTYKEV